MNRKRRFDSWFRGWLPKDPIPTSPSKQIKLPTINRNIVDKWAMLPFAVSGALMITAAIVSAYLGYDLLLSYQRSIGEYHEYMTDYASLQIGLLNFLAFGVDLFAAMLLLLRKHVATAKFLVISVLALGLAAPFISRLNAPLIYTEHPTSIFMSYAPFWLKGLLAGLPMLAFSIPALTLIQLNRKKLKQDISLKNWIRDWLPKEPLRLAQKYPLMVRWMTKTVVVDVIVSALLGVLGDVAGLTAGHGLYLWPTTVAAILVIATTVVAVFAKRKMQQESAQAWA